MKKTLGAIFGALAIISSSVVLGLLILATLTIIRGWVLCKLWIWFAVPTFNLPVLSIAQALGVSLIVGMLTLHQMPKNDKGIGKSLVTAAFYYGITLVVGYIVHLFM
jgi:hypothetical protein